MIYTPYFGFHQKMLEPSFLKYLEGKRHFKIHIFLGSVNLDSIDLVRYIIEQTYPYHKVIAHVPKYDGSIKIEANKMLSDLSGKYKLFAESKPISFLVGSTICPSVGWSWQEWTLNIGWTDNVLSANIEFFKRTF